MNCQRASELFSEYIDGMIDDDLGSEVKNHIDTCSECRQEYELLKNIVLECHRFEEENLPEDFHQKLHLRLVNEVGDGNRLKNRWVGVRKYYAAAAAGIMLVISMGVAVNSGILNFPQKSSSSAKEEASTQMMMDAAPAEMAPAESLPKAKVQYDKEEGQVKNTAYEERLTYPVLTISLSEEEYKKYYQNLVVTIEGYGGYLESKDSAAYIIPGENLDAMMNKLKDTFKLTGVSLESQDITDRYNRLRDELLSLEEEKHSDALNSMEADDSKADISKEITMKKEELKKLDSLLKSIYIIVNKY